MGAVEDGGLLPYPLREGIAGKGGFPSLTPATAPEPSKSIWDSPTISCWRRVGASLTRGARPGQQGWWISPVASLGEELEGGEVRPIGQSRAEEQEGVCDQKTSCLLAFFFLLSGTKFTSIERLELGPGEGLQGCREFAVADGTAQEVALPSLVAEEDGSTTAAPATVWSNRLSPLSSVFPLMTDEAPWGQLPRSGRSLHNTGFCGRKSTTM